MSDTDIIVTSCTMCQVQSIDNTINRKLPVEVRRVVWLLERYVTGFGHEDKKVSQGGWKPWNIETLGIVKSEESPGNYL